MVDEPIAWAHREPARRMMRTTPFYERTSTLNQTGLWTHWAGYLSATRYLASEKFEYYAVRNSAGLFDTSPLYKYRVHGPDAEPFLSGVVARDIRRCRPGRAQYTVWCDDDGWVLEDGVVLRTGETEFLLSTARPNLAYFQSLVGYSAVEIDDVSADLAALAIQGPRSRAVLSAASPDVGQLRYFQLVETKLGPVPATVSRTGFTGDLGYELWVRRDDALDAWDVVTEASKGHGVQPFGETALLMTRLEAGLLLLGTDFTSSRLAWTDAERSSLLELGMGWMVANLETDDRRFIGREAITRQLAEGRRSALVGLLVDWRAWDDLYESQGLLSPKNHVPIHDESMLYDTDGSAAGHVTSFMYSPMVQRHIALGRVRPELDSPGQEVGLDVLVNHELHRVPARVARVPFYNPSHRTA